MNTRTQIHIHTQTKIAKQNQKKKNPEKLFVPYLISHSLGKENQSY